MLSLSKHCINKHFKITPNYMDKHLISSEYSDKSPKLNVNLPFIVHGQEFYINSIMDNMGECFKKIL